MAGIRRVCVFSGSRSGTNPGYERAARELGEAMAARGLGLVYGGASVGLMGAVADAVLRAKGEAIGVIPEALVSKELAHAKLTELHVVETMHERKAKMVDLSDAFVALPGGFGTFDELFEVLTWAQLGIHEKPIALLDAEGYYQPLVAMVDSAIRAGFVPEDQRALLLIEPTPARVLDALESYVYPTLGRKWALPGQE